MTKHIASFFGIGYFPFASGTAGSLVALPLGFLAAHVGGMWGVLVAAGIIYIIGLVVVSNIKEPDPSFVVIDEVAGQMFALAPFASFFDWRYYAAAFALFRLFDITKPWPASYFDRKNKNVDGVMQDDIVAGFYAALTLAVIVYCIQ